MFPFQQGELVSFQVPNNDKDNPSNNVTQTYLNPQKFEQEVSTPSVIPLPPLQYYHSQVEHNNNLVVGNDENARKGKSRRSRSVGHEKVIDDTKRDEFSNEDDVAKKRTLHREIERQRRQEMANLYSSLRNLLPIEYIKGKRSICDHIAEAAKYIKDLEKNVKELGDKRDKLKESSSSLEVRLAGDSNVGCSTSSSFSSLVEIEISTSIGDGDVFPLSRVLAVLVKEAGLSIASCVYSKADQRWIYIIHCEVNDGTSIDSNLLQLRLMNEIRS